MSINESEIIWDDPVSELPRDSDIIWDESTVSPPVKATSPKSPASSSGIAERAIVDPLVGLARGVFVEIPSTIIGLADIPTMGIVGKSIDETAKAIGLPTQEEARGIFNKMLTSETQDALKNVSEAKGFVPTVKTMVQYPSSIVQMVVENLAPMKAGAMAGAKLLKAVGKPIISEIAGKKVVDVGRAAIAGGIGEGITTAGQNIEQTRLQTEGKDLTPKQVALTATSAGLTGLIGVLGGKLAQKLDIADINTLLAGGIGTASKKKILVGLALGSLKEGTVEELPQSAQERIAQNISLGKPWDEGVAEDAATGWLVGMAQGAGASVASGALAAARAEISDKPVDLLKETQAAEEGATVAGGASLETEETPITLSPEERKTNADKSLKDLDLAYDGILELQKPKTKEEADNLALWYEAQKRAILSTNEETPTTLSEENKKAINGWTAQRLNELTSFEEVRPLTTEESLEKDFLQQNLNLPESVAQGTDILEVLKAQKDLDEVNVNAAKRSESIIQKVETDNINALENEITASINTFINRPRPGMDAEQISKQKHAEGMQYAAMKRKATGKPTDKELTDTINRLNSNYTGKPVSVNGAPAIVTGTAFGKVTVQLQDGSSASVEKTDIVAPVATKKDAINFLKEEGANEYEQFKQNFLAPPTGEAPPPVAPAEVPPPQRQSQVIDEFFSRLQTRIKDTEGLNALKAQFTSTNPEAVNQAGEVLNELIRTNIDLFPEISKEAAGRKAFKRMSPRKAKQIKKFGLTKEDIALLTDAEFSKFFRAIENQEIFAVPPALQGMYNKFGKLFNNILGLDMEPVYIDVPIRKVIDVSSQEGLDFLKRQGIEDVKEYLNKFGFNYEEMIKNGQTEVAIEIAGVYIANEADDAGRNRAYAFKSKNPTTILHEGLHGYFRSVGLAGWFGSEEEVVLFLEEKVAAKDFETKKEFDVWLEEQKKDFNKQSYKKAGATEEQGIGLKIGRPFKDRAPPGELLNAVKLRDTVWTAPQGEATEALNNKALELQLQPGNAHLVRVGFVDDKGRFLDKNRDTELIKEYKAKNQIRFKIGEASLIAEAKKYKTALEFVKAQGEPLYHSTRTENIPSINQKGFTGDIGEMSGKTGGKMEKGVFLYGDKESADIFGKNFKDSSTVEVKVNGKIYDANSESKYGWEDDLQIQEIAKDKKIINQLRKDGYVGVNSVELGTPATFVFEPKTIKTKSQLTSIWNKAQEKEPAYKTGKASLVDGAPDSFKISGAVALSKPIEKPPGKPKIQVKLKPKPEKKASTPGIEKTPLTAKKLAAELGIPEEDVQAFFKTISNEEEIEKAGSLLTDRSTTIDYILQNKTLPKGIREMSFVVAAANQAVESGDSDLINALFSQGSIIELTSWHAQELQVLRELYKNSAVGAVAEVKKAKMDAAEKKDKNIKTKIKQETESNKKEFNNFQKKLSPETKKLHRWLDLLEC